MMLLAIPAINRDKLFASIPQPQILQLPDRSPWWPPREIAGNGYSGIQANGTAMVDWFQANILSKLPSQVMQSETEYALNPLERQLINMSLVEWIAARAANRYSCEQMAVALVKRTKYMQHVQHVNNWMYWDSFPGQFDSMIERAAELDSLAVQESPAALAPLYCYPIPVKGTMATIDFPSSVGYAVLHTHFARDDCAVVKLLKAANGLVFGKTNVPEGAGAQATGNYANGLNLNPWGPDSQSGGSSGGAASAVASFSTAIAITEDTAGSTNLPAVRNHIYGFDPPKYHYPNGGNPALTVRNDQIGVVARSFDDIILYDQALLANQKEHSMAKDFVDGLGNAQIRLGCHRALHPDPDATTPAIAATYAAAAAALATAGFTFIQNCSTIEFWSAGPKAPESTFLATFSSLTEFMVDMLGERQLTYHDLHDSEGYTDFGLVKQSSVQPVGISEESRALHAGPIPAEQSAIYNTYFDENQVDLLIGVAQTCDDVLWSDELSGQASGTGCKGHSTFFGGMQFPLPCVSVCHPQGVLGVFDKSFTKAKFIVPIGLTSAGKPLSLHFMSRAGPRNTDVAPIEWVFDHEGPKNWNLEEVYMIKRIVDVLVEAGFARADAPTRF